LVRIQRRVSRKRYLNSKRIYEYERVSLHIPRKYHELIKPFLNQDLGVSVAAEKGSIVITLTPQKTVQRAESPSNTLYVVIMTSTHAKSHWSGGRGTMGSLSFGEYVGMYAYGSSPPE
jgi:hypothetical protein